MVSVPKKLLIQIRGDNHDKDESFDARLQGEREEP